jgi:hypothetical protein
MAASHHDGPHHSLLIIASYLNALETSYEVDIGEENEGQRG